MVMTMMNSVIVHLCVYVWPADLDPPVYQVLMVCQAATDAQERTE